MSFPFISVPERTKKTKDFTGFVSRAELISKMPRRLGLAAEDPRIGKMGDKTLARSLGIAPSTVRRARNALGLPLFTPYRRNASQDILGQEDLGSVPDRIIAARLGVAKSYVQRIRTENGVQSTAGRCIPRRPAVWVQNDVDKLMEGWGR